MEAKHSYMATKEELKDLRGELIDRISKLEGGFKVWLAMMSLLLIIVNAVVVALVKEL